MGVTNLLAKLDHSNKKNGNFCDQYFQMSLKVHETDELHSPHVDSLKPFPGVVLVNHFPPPVPANIL